MPRENQFVNTADGRKKYKLCVKKPLQEFQANINIISTDSLLKFSVQLQEKMDKLQAMRGKGTGQVGMCGVVADNIVLPVEVFARAVSRLGLPEEALFQKLSAQQEEVRGSKLKHLRGNSSLLSLTYNPSNHFSEEKEVVDLSNYLSLIQKEFPVLVPCSGLPLPKRY